MGQVSEIYNTFDGNKCYRGGAWEMGYQGKLGHNGDI